MACTFLDVDSERSEVPLMSSMMCKEREKRKRLRPECCH